MPGSAGNVITPEIESVEQFLPNTNILTHCVYTNDEERITECFDDENDKFHETAFSCLNERNNEGRTPLDLAAILGRQNIIRILVDKGADVGMTTIKGYSALHFAAAWGKVETVKVLIELLADFHSQNIFGERPRETALRYNHSECVDYLDWAEARAELVSTIKRIQETMADPEQVQGRLVKDERVLVNSLIRERNDWIDKTSDATTQDFINQKHEVDQILEPIYTKLSEPRPETSAGKKKK